MSRTFSMVVLGTTLALFASSAALTGRQAAAQGAASREGTRQAQGTARTKVRPATKKPLRPSGDQPQLYGGEAVIEQALATPTDLEFTDMPLTNVLDYLADYHSQKFGHRFLIQHSTRRPLPTRESHPTPPSRKV